MFWLTIGVLVAFGIVADFVHKHADASYATRLPRVHRERPKSPQLIELHRLPLITVVA